MANSEMFGFSLESTNETLEKTRQKATKKSALASGLGGESPTMDTDHDEKMETLKPQVRFNADFDKWASPCKDKVVSSFIYSLDRRC